MERDFDIRPGDPAMSDRLAPPFYSAKDEGQRVRYLEEGRFPRQRSEGAGNYGTGGYYGNAYRPVQNDEGREGYPDGYRHLGDRRWAFAGHDQRERQGYRSLAGRSAAEGIHQGKGPRSYRRTDERILEDLNERLYDDPFLNATRIETEVHGGEVLLKGTVDSKQSKRRAEDIADTVHGVTQVQNSLRIAQSDSPGMSPSPDVPA